MRALYPIRQEVFNSNQSSNFYFYLFLKVIETISKENVNVSAKQLDELIELMAKEEILETQEKIEKALAKEQEIKDRAELLVDKVEMLKDKAKEIRETVS